MEDIASGNGAGFSTLIQADVQSCEWWFAMPTDKSLMALMRSEPSYAFSVFRTLRIGAFCCAGLVAVACLCLLAIRGRLSVIALLCGLLLAGLGIIILFAELKVGLEWQRRATHCDGDTVEESP